MKKNSFFLLFVFVASNIFSQAIPNADFENWTNMGNYNDPDQWGTLNAVTDANGVYTVTPGTPGYSGNYYLAVRSLTFNSSVQCGIAATGIINPVDLSVTGGFPYAIRSAALTGVWQYMVASLNDQGSISIFLTKWNTVTNSRDTISATHFDPHGMVMSWETFSIPLNYLLPGNPDTCQIIITSSNATPANNSYLWIDSLGFSGITDVKDFSFSENNFSFYPNPATENITVSFPGNTSHPEFQIYDLAGNLILEKTPDLFEEKNSLTISLEGVEPGIYFIRFVSEKGIEAEKIIIE